MTKYIAILLLSIQTLPAFSQHTIRQPNAIPLHGEWLFTLDPAAVGEREQWYRDNYPTNRWDKVTVPHCFSADNRYLNYTGNTWCRRTFPWQPAANKRVLLHFDGAYYETILWINNQKVGSHEGGYTPFEFDITEYLKAGENTVAVSVNNNTWRRGTIPGAKDEYREADAQGGQFPGWLNYGGLLRPVYLTVEPAVYVENVKVEATPDLAKGTATLRVKTRIRNTTGQTASPRPAFIVVQNGRTLTVPWKTRTEPVGASQTAVLIAETSLKPADVTLWSLDNPQLYQLSVVMAGDTTTTNFGIRKVEVRNTQLLLNGQPIKVAGGNRVIDYPGLGSMEPDWLIEKDLRLMKEAGMELQRLTHYTPSETIYDWADRNGMLIITEAGNWQLSPKQMDNDTIRTKFRQQFREMAERDWNHPSVIAYSVGNEYLSETPAGQRWTKDMIAYARSLDSTRLYTFASMRLNILPKKPEDEASQYVDFVSTNTYGNHLHVLKHIHSLYPDKPIFISEYGIRSDTKSGEAGQVSHLEQFLKDIRQLPYVIGASWWSFNDYQSRFHGTNPNGYRPWGLVRPDRSKRPLYETHREEMAPVTIEKLSFTPGPEGQHQLQVRVTARKDFPAYTVKGYLVRVARSYTPGESRINARSETPGYNLPTLQPGQSADITIPVRGFDQTITLDVVKPTGFSIVSKTIDLTNDPRTSNR
ncbi:hypothetical protein GCM10023187_40870 [Nibrella viscosa]|uniref:Beta-glucuronidase n=1 Tax=Nibrella viscosa TaxID=1084524 RepID=A0ABP8KR63_9BACT